MQVSALALYEIAVHLAPSSGAGGTTEAAGRLRARMAFLSEITGGVPDLAPTHQPLVDKLGGTLVGIPEVPYTAWRSKVQSAWQRLAIGEPLPDELAAFINGLAGYVGETGRDFVETVDAAAALGEMTPDESRLFDKLSRALGGGIVDRIRMAEPPTVHDRFEAHTSMLDLHGKRAHGRSVGKYAAREENHAVDLNLLQHLAEGCVVLTSDYRLIEDIDASGTKQAAWVRCPGELLVGRMPPGAPFGANARRVAMKHRPRLRAELLALDQKGIELAKRLSGDR